MLGTGPTPSTGLPLHDWQFWVATLVALLAAAWMFWRMFGGMIKRRRGRGATRRVELTLDRRAVSYPKPDDGD